MLQKVRVQNYKSLRDVSVELERFTVFVGANGSGKTSILEAIDGAVWAASEDPRTVFTHDRHGDWVYTRGGSGDLRIDCETNNIGITLEATPPERHPATTDRMQREEWEFHVTPAGRIDRDRTLKYVRLNATALARPSYSQDSPPRLERSGKGLASVLAFMALNDPPGFDHLVETARSLIPRLRRIRFRKEPVFRTESELVRFGHDTVERRTRRKYQGELILLDFDHAENVSARTASEGTMLMLGLLTALLSPNRPRILLLDDLDHGLHPLAQKQMVEVIGRILAEYPDIQILATAHSPYLLNYLSPEQVRIVALGEDGHTRCGRLTDHPSFETWKEEMAPGEMWSLFGEKWLAEQEVGP